MHSFATFVGSVKDVLGTVARLPYFRMYRKNTLEPATAICMEQDDTKLQILLESWLLVKKSELEYVQIAVCMYVSA
jgi:hypothetical protein